jgi:hypothetical protein
MSTLYLSLRSISCIQSVYLYRTAVTSISVLLFHLRQARKGRFPSGIQTKILCTFVFSPHIMLVLPILFRLIHSLCVLYRTSGMKVYFSVFSTSAGNSLF